MGIGDTYQNAMHGSIIGGQGNTNKIIHNHSGASGFDLLCKHAVPTALHNSGEVSEQPKCHPGTRVAILDHLIAWASALTYAYPITWLHGPAGAGKSAILRTVAQRLFEHGLLLGSFFFFRTSPGRNSANSLISTIAYQLSLSFPATRPQIEQAVERNPLIFSLSLWDQAEALIVTPLLNVYKSLALESDKVPRIIIIDGLDECQDSDKQCSILKVLCRILQALPLPFAVLLASRPEHHIREAFSIGDLNALSSRVSLDDSYEPDADIRTFLTDRFKIIQETHQMRFYLPAPWPSSDAIERLVAKASGQFIYASTVDKFVSSPRYRPSERLDIVLGTLDAGELKPFEQLDALYSTIFRMVDLADLPGALRLLGAFLVPYRDWKSYKGPPSPKFLELLFGLASGSARSLLFDFECLLTIKKDDQPVHFFHASLSDFLFDKSRSGIFYIDAEMVYADLAFQSILHLYTSSDWEDFLAFFCNQHRQIFANAAPTPDLRNAIQNCDMSKVVGFFDLEWQGRCDIRVQFLDAISSSVIMSLSVIFSLQKLKTSPQTFSDAENMYRIHLKSYAKVLEPMMQIYIGENLAHYLLITLAMVDNVTATPCMKLFPFSSAMKEYDMGIGFSISHKGTGDEFHKVMKDLFNDPQGRYFVDENRYADIALYLMKCMTESEEAYIHASWHETYAVITVGDIINTIFPVLLSKAMIRHDLTDYLETVSLDSEYMEMKEVASAIKAYLLRSTSRERTLGSSLSINVSRSSLHSASVGTSIGELNATPQRRTEVRHHSNGDKIREGSTLERSGSLTSKSLKVKSWAESKVWSKRTGFTLQVQKNQYGDELV